jgi:hypothetical protein
MARTPKPSQNRSRNRRNSLFMAAAADRPASQILREMMRGYIQQQRESRECEAFLRAKVTAARRSVESGQGHPDADVEAEFSARRERAYRPE